MHNNLRTTLERPPDFPGRRFLWSRAMLPVARTPGLAAAVFAALRLFDCHPEKASRDRPGPDFGDCFSPARGPLLRRGTCLLLLLALTGALGALPVYPAFAQDAAPLWSADMSVAELGNGSIGAFSAGDFTNQGGRAGLQAKRLYYYGPNRTLRLAFTEGVRGEELTLQVGTLTLNLPPDSRDSSFTWHDVGDVGWKDGQTLPVRIVEGVNTPATGVPAITGRAEAGETLTADTSGISDADGMDNATFSYQWIANDGNTDADIEGETDPTYDLADSDVGKTVKVRVSFVDDDGLLETLTSAATAAIGFPSNTPARGAPVISGRALEGETLTADTTDISDADGLTNVSYSYQWITSNGNGDGDFQRDVGSTYDLSEADVGKTVKVKVSFTDDRNNAESLTSAATAAIGFPSNTPARGAPVISGRALEGETLTADTTDISDADGLTNVSYSYQWITSNGNGDGDFQRDVGSTYDLSEADVGKTVKVKVSFTDDRNNAESLTSAATAPVAVRTNTPATGAPIIRGYASVSETLLADTSGIADEDGLTNASYSYQWIRTNWNADADIEGETSSVYQLSVDDYGDAFKVRVSFVDDRNNAESLTSVATHRVGLVACAVGDGQSTATEITVEDVPVTVESTTDDYFVLYVRPDLHSSREIPVSLTLGQESATTLTDRLSPLPAEHYRVEQYLIADPGDVDGDCVDDITELADPVGMNPLNPAPAIGLADGAVAIPDHATFEALSYQHNLARDSNIHLAGLEYVNFWVAGTSTSNPVIYFINTERWRVHWSFAFDVRLEKHPLFRKGWMKGEIVFHPNVVAPDGSLGVYRYGFDSSYAFSYEAISSVHELLAASMPLLDNNLAYYLRHPVAIRLYGEEQAQYDASRVNLLFKDDILPDVDFIPLNLGEGYGFLRLMTLDERPNPSDVVIYETLPNELSRVAGIITTVPQTPLSHVNLRAVQDSVPNAFIRDALDDEEIDDLTGRYVYYAVTESGYTIRAATPAEVEAHYAAARPAITQAPERDLSVTTITDLDEIGFDDWNAFGVKAANVAVLGTLGFPAGTVPDGFAVPFHFYDEFMKHNGFYDDVEALLADPEFRTDYDTQESELKRLRKRIKKGESPQWMLDALVAMHDTYPDGQSLRYRSSTNNEDLPGFSGAGLYDSKTQDPDETLEDGIDKSIKAVYASLWNFRAFVERDSHGIDHLTTAMGVLVHPNYKDELANGVAVSFDPFYDTDGAYYVNTQLGEDLVTNPDAYSAPEELLLHQDSSYDVLARSNLVARDRLLMSDAQMEQLRGHLDAIHDEFAALYEAEAGGPFAMEIEFKITSENVLAIKQARPWVFPDDNQPATGLPTISGLAQVGETLTADTSGIADEDRLDQTTFRYQWIRNDGGPNIGISGETASSYTLVSADIGKTIKVRVSFTDDAGNEETLTSAPTAAVAAKTNSPATGTPTISGTAQVGETLTADTSGIADANGLDNGTFDYQWVSNRSADPDIAGATVSTYTLVSDDVGKTIKVQVSFTDDGGNEETLTSAATDAVAYVPGPPGAPAGVRIKAVDSELQLSWQPPAGENKAPVQRYRIQYREEDGSIQEVHTTLLTHTLSNLTNGVAYMVQVTAENAAGYGFASAEMSATPQAEVATLPDTPQNLSGRSVYHRRVALDWDDVPGADSYEVQFYDWNSRSLVVLPHEEITLAFNGSSAVADRLTGTSFWWLRVRVVNAAGVSEWSKMVQIIATGASDWEPAEANSPATGLPTISGTVQVGQTLAADVSGISDEDGLANATFTYQWTADDADIEDATGSTYDLTDDDVGKAVKVRVSFTDDSGNEETLTSEATGEVTAQTDREPLVSLELVEPELVTLHSVVNNETSVLLQWTKPASGTQPTGYRIYRTEYDRITGVGLPQVIVSDTGNTDTTYSDTTVKELTTYAYAVSGLNGAAEGPKSGLISVTTDPHPNAPSAPIGLQAQLASDGVRLSWNEPGYRLAESTCTYDVSRVSPSEIGGVLNSVPIAETSYLDTTIVYEDIYYEYGVTAICGGYYGVMANVAINVPDPSSDTPSRPGIYFFTEQVPGRLEILVSVPATEEDIIGIAVYRSTYHPSPSLESHPEHLLDPLSDGLSYTFALPCPASDSDESYEWCTYVDSTVESDRVYYYWARSVNAEGVLSAPSGVAFIRTRPQPSNSAPEPPTDLTVTDNQIGSVTLQWVAPAAGPAPTGYKVYRSSYDGLNSPYGGFNLTRIGTSNGAATSYIDTTTHLRPRIYRYSVRSFNDEDTSGWPESSVLVQLRNPGADNAPGAPGNLTATWVNDASAIRGTTRIGETLTVDTSGIADEDGLINPEFTYQWVRSAGGTDVDIAEATRDAYTLVSDDIGKSIRVRVSFTDDGGNEETLTSAATEIVAATAPGPPQHLNVFPHGAGALDLYWEAPASDGGSPITGHRVQWKESAGSWDTPEDVSEETVAGTTLTLTGLTGGMEYAIRVRAGNGVGDGPASVEVVAEAPGVWSAELTVGVEDEYAGYSFFAGVGSLSDTDFSVDGVTHVVGDLIYDAETLYFSLNREMTAGFVLLVGPAELASGDATVQEGGIAHTYRWAGPGLDWSTGDTVAVGLTLAEATGEEQSGRNAPATGLPIISGSAQVGETLTASTSDIDDSDGLTNVSYSYQWLADDVNIQGATNSTYTLTDSDVGMTIKVKVSFTDDAGHAETLTSQATDTVAPPPNRPATGAPSIRGVLQDQQLLTADTIGIADADGLHNATISYRWIRVTYGDSSEITGQTSSTYTLTASDVGNSIQLRVAFNDDRGHAESIISAATEAVVASDATQELLWLSTMTPEDPDGLDADFNFDSAAHNGSLSPAAFTDGEDTRAITFLGASFGSDTTLALELDLEPPAAQIATWRLALHDTELGFSDAAMTQTDTNPPSYRFQWDVTALAVDDRDLWDDGDAFTVSLLEAINLKAAGVPTISGTPQVNETLDAAITDIADGNGLDSAAYTYRWTAGGTDIDGATGSSLTLTSSQEGQTIQVRVTFTDDDGFSETLTSVATDTVAPAEQANNPAMGLPAISGTPQVEQTLTADTSAISDQDGLSNVSYRYQWMAGGADIAGATGSSLALTASQQGQTVQVRVDFEDDAGNSESLTSVATDPVAAKPIPLTASFSDVPSSHSGSGEFTFDLAFSENVKLSYKTLRDHAFTEDGGSVIKAKRKVQGSNQTWTITVKADGNGAVSMTLPATTDCDADGAICTADGRKLSDRVELTVSGPDG